MAPMSDGGHRGYNVHDDNYYDGARIWNHDDGINYPNMIGDDADHWQGCCRELMTCDAATQSY